MEGSAGIERNGARGIQHADEVGGRGGDYSPYLQGGLKFAQAVISQTTDGRWKLTVQSDNQVVMMLIGPFEEIVKELRFAATREWHQRS